MKTHTTNYINTFIEIAEDCPEKKSAIPPLKGDKKSIANRQFELLEKNPYKYTSDDVLFLVYADKCELTESEYETARAQFFSKGQPCFRTSPLTKRYGFGIHSNEKGQIALYGSESVEYARFLTDKNIKKVKAMRSSKA